MIIISKELLAISKCCILIFELNVSISKHFEYILVKFYLVILIILDSSKKTFFCLNVENYINKFMLKNIRIRCKLDSRLFNKVDSRYSGCPPMF